MGAWSLLRPVPLRSLLGKVPYLCSTLEGYCVSFSAAREPAALQAACQIGKMLLCILCILQRARGARPPQAPGDPPWRHDKNNAFAYILEGFGRKPSNYQRAGPRRPLALVGVSWR